MSTPEMLALAELHHLLGHIADQKQRSQTVILSHEQADRCAAALRSASAGGRPDREAMSPAETLAASSILDVMSGGDTSWRTRISESDMLESADWRQAMLYARAALSAGVPALINTIARPEQQLAYGQSHVAEKILQGAIFPHLEQRHDD